MNYDDELERAQARRSRKRQTETPSSASRSRSSAARSSAAHRARTQTSASRTTAGSHTASGYRTAGSAYQRRKKKQERTKKIIIGVVIGVLALIAAIVIGVYAYFNHHLNKSQSHNEFNVEEVQNTNIPVEVREKMKKGFWTVAVFGVDSRDNSLGAGNQSDVIMIVNLNRQTGEIKLVSVFRDTYLNINDKNTYNKINAAYASGGPEAAVKALNKNLDLNITHYATFNWKAVATVINILGGVEIDISQSEFHYINAFITETVKGTGIGSVQLKSAGTHLLDGVQAVAYGRLRLMDSDYARTERQRIVIQKAFEKMKKADLATLNSVVGHVFEMCATNIEFNEMAGFIPDIMKFHLGETSGFPAARGEVKIKIGSNKLSCVIPQTLESNVKSLHNFLFGEENYSPSSTVMEISRKIAEISGLATAGEEIGHVPTDKGYIPKPTTTAAAEKPDKTEEPDETEETESRAETSEGESSSETSEGESESASDGSTESPAESESESEPLVPGNPMGPGGHYGPGYSQPEDEDGRPQSPADMTTAPTQHPGFGPGYVPEATTASPGPGGTKPADGQTSVTVPSSSASENSAAPGASQAATEPNLTIPSTNNQGPAAEAAASPGA